ncbi:SulP family inorganic anion transporter [uncultured Allofournierella sp.]|uniref:SulP family inorganic anion transporter n=1 Tax=uncultured Allofournierella sp. TaxID=1940258 RepID=UPI0037527539
MKTYWKDLQQEFAGYNGAALLADILAGLTVAAVALPLALAFGVSSGADAASGMITAILAGIVIGILGGAAYQISGPTGAMAAILVGIAGRYGVQGVLTAGFLTGAILLVMALLRVGKLVSYIPVPVITGFTSGIAIIIALGQIDNFFGTTSQGENALQKLASYASLGFKPNPQAVLFGVLAVVVMLAWPKKLARWLPGSLMAIVVAIPINFLLNPNSSASQVAEVGAIPQTLITPHGLLQTGLDVSMLPQLLLPACSIAALGMIESLLCGAAAARMTGQPLNSTRELVAQGIGNLVIPLFGGVPATAAIARTSVGIKSGGRTRMVSVVHAITLILSMFLLGGIMGRIPLATLAGVLMVTAWRMNEWPAIRRLFQNKLRASQAQFLATMAATVVFDLVVAILVGIGVAMLLFVLKSCNLEVAVSDVRRKQGGQEIAFPQVKVVYLTGPLFFGTQEQLTRQMAQMAEPLKGVIFSMRGVPYMDDTAADMLCELTQQLNQQGTQVLFCAVQPKVKEVMEQAGLVEQTGAHCFVWDAMEAIDWMEQLNLLKTTQSV